MSSIELRGAVVWGVVPYVPEAPFSVYRADDDPLELPDAAPLFKAARKSESEFRFLVRAKARPVLVLADVPDPRVDEYLALRLVRLSELSEGARANVVDQNDELLFHVKGDTTPGLEEEFAVMIAALVRLHVTAVDSTNVLGRLDANELRIVHERFVKLHRLDLLPLIREEINRLKELQRRRAATPE